MHTTKIACDKRNYRRHKKYFRTLNPVAQAFSLRKAKTSIFQNISFCFFKLAEALHFYFLPYVTLSSAAGLVACFCEILCAANSQKCDARPVRCNALLWLFKIWRLHKFKQFINHNPTTISLCLLSLYLLRYLGIYQLHYLHRQLYRHSQAKIHEIFFHYWDCNDTLCPTDLHE
jgi:hypothetical protein